MPSLAGAGHLSGVHATVPLMLLLFAASYGFAPFGIHPEVAVPAASYLRILTWGTLPLVFYGATRRYLQGVGQVRIISVTIVAGNLLNWFANWVLIYGKLGFPALGVNGSALSTVISRIFIALALIGSAWRYERGRGHPLFRHWAGPSMVAAAGTGASWVASGRADCAVRWARGTCVTLFAGRLTPVALATHTIVFNYASLTYMVPLGLASAAAVSVGHAVGAEDPGAGAAGGVAGDGPGHGIHAAGRDQLLHGSASIDCAVYARSASDGYWRETAADCGGLPDL